MDDVKCGMAQSGIHAGFPSPATDYMTQAIDLNKELVRHPAATLRFRQYMDTLIRMSQKQKKLPLASTVLSTCFSAETDSRRTHYD